MEGAPSLGYPFFLLRALLDPLLCLSRHSLLAIPICPPSRRACACADYGGEFVAAVQKGAVCATQFHPEKSGAAGLDILNCFLRPETAAAAAYQEVHSNGAQGGRTAAVGCSSGAGGRASHQGDCNWVGGGCGSWQIM
jgi:hypothetical protein